jgi:hypothetical protein
LRLGESARERQRGERKGDTDRKKTGIYTEGETQNRKETEGRVETATEWERHRERH